MKKIILLFAIAAPTVLWAQTEYSTGNIKTERYDSITDFRTRPMLLNKSNAKIPASVAAINVIDVTTAGFKKVLTRDLSTIVTGDPSLDGVGSYASIKLDQAQASVAAAALVGGGKMPFIGIKANFNGGVIDNVIQTFSGGKVSSQFEGRIDISFFKPIYKYTTAGYTSRNEALTLCDAKINSDRYKFYDDLNTRIIKTDETLTKNKLDNPTATAPNLATAAADEKKYISALKKDYDNKFDKRRIDTLSKCFADNSSYSTKKIYWVSFYGSVNGQKLYLHNLTKPFNEQVYDTTFIGGEAGISFNLLYLSSYKAYKLLNGYMRIGLGYVRGNNKDQQSLTTFKNTFTETHTEGDSIENSTTSSIEQKSYADSSYHEFHGVKLSLDLYKFITKNISIHGMVETAFTKKLDVYSAEGVVRDESKIANVDVGLGLVFGVKKKDETKTLLNIEPIVVFQNLTDKYEENTPLKKRVKFELRLSLPFNYFVLQNQ